MCLVLCFSLICFVSSDFLRDDVHRLYPHLRPHVQITVVEAGPSLLGPFDKALQEYAQGLFQQRNIDVRLGTAVTNVETFEKEDYQFPAKRALLSDGTSLEFGTLVWSAGLAPTDLVLNLPLERDARSHRLLVDEYLRVKGHEGSIWAIGDAALNTSGPPLPQLAQVARQQGMYMADVLSGKKKQDSEPFKFFSLGSMAFMGELKGIYDGSSAGELKGNGPAATPTEDFMSRIRNMHPAMTGFSALLLWRFAYWGRQVSVVNKILIPVFWMKSFIFGRDVSRY